MRGRQEFGPLEVAGPLLNAFVGMATEYDRHLAAAGAA
jgi:hypothetical protein